MNITASTTDEQILAPVAAAKQTLLAFVTEQVDSQFQYGDQMVSLAQNVMSAEAVASAKWGYRDTLLAVDHLPDDEKVSRCTRYLVRLLSAQPDDTWSGRKNDSKRSANDAVRAFATDALDDLR